jgi:hypothetical protein
MKRNTELQTPWRDSGLMHSPGDIKVVKGQRTWPDVGEWRDNPVFDLTLKMRGTERGRSAAYFRWEVIGGDLPKEQVLPMFITDVGHVIMLGMAGCPGGVITGKFFVIKRGQNYGITPVQPDDTPPRGQERPTDDLALPGGAEAPTGHS